MKSEKSDVKGDHKFSPEENAAMRAYLQRIEVRLSTLHRIAGAFLGGAGLLVLFPVFFKEVFTGFAEFITEYQQIYHSKIMVEYLIFIPFLLSIIIPLYSLFLLLRDLIHFYFVGHSPGFNSKIINPRFALSGIPFSPSESPEAIIEIQKYEYSKDLINFIIPFGEVQASYYDDVYQIFKEGIIPEGRDITSLLSKGVIQKTKSPNEYVINGLKKPQSISESDIHRFNSAFGLAGVQERDLFEEVAKGEVSLVRHALCLRRLVLRYMKALIMFILTTITSFALLGVMHLYTGSPYLAMSIGYLLWGLITPYFVSMPIRWIGDQSSKDANIKKVKKDVELQDFEIKVKIMSFVAIFCSIIVISYTIIR